MRKARQRGFTLVEVMFAAAAGLFIMIPAVTILFQGIAWYDEIEGQLAVNREAREAMDVIGNGGRRNTNGNDATPYVYGIHGRKAMPVGALRTNYALAYTSNNLTLNGDQMASMAVTCTAAAAPLPDCASTGQVKTVAGWMGSDASLNTATRSVNSGRTVETTVTITDPYEAQRLDRPSSASETYRTVLTLNRDETDP